MPAKKALSEYITTSKYARHLKAQRRRETFLEAVNRGRDMMLRKYPQARDEIEWAYGMMADRKVLGSQRALQYAGKPIEKRNARIMNCIGSFADRVRFFQEAFWLLLCGCGVGFSVQKHHVAKLPSLKPRGDAPEIVHVIEDSIEGWADAAGVLIESYLVRPAVVRFEYHLVREKDSPISSGGKAPGPEPLRLALERMRGVLDACVATGLERLRPIDVFDLVMHEADAVLSGGTRRSATIALFSDDDEEMSRAKTGDWFSENPQRARANISALRLRDATSFAAYKASFEHTKQWGEPGDLWASHQDIIINPCVEVSFWPCVEIDGVVYTGWQACNLSSVYVSTVVDRKDFLERCRAAAIVGTLQAGFARYDYLGPVSEAIIAREALLGVSMTGILDRPDISMNAEILEQGVGIIRETNRDLASKIGINPAARLTALKPEGTGSLVLGTLASGRHGWPFRRGIRHVQANKNENPLAHFKLYNPHAVEHSVWSTNGVDDVLMFPIEAPEGAVLEDDMTAIQSLEQVKFLQEHWVDAGRNAELCTQPWLRNSVSNTIKVGDDEWDDAARYIYENRDYFTGVSLLGRSGDKDYRQAPNVSVRTIAEMYEVYDPDLIDFCTSILQQNTREDAWDFIEILAGSPSLLPTPSEIRAKSLLDSRLDLWGVDMRMAVYCLKDVYYIEKYARLVNEWREVPYELMYEEDDNTSHVMEAACAGGACTI